ncbi:MAG: GumC family protein [Desulfocapsa sp.]|nr:GumC family protein [Desulfocapsa sp.]
MTQNKNPAVEEIHLSDYWNVLKKRKVLVITFLVATVLVTMVMSFLMAPVYQATARMAIESESSTSPVTGQRMEYIDRASQQLTFNTHFTLIKSKPIILNLITEIAASEDEFNRLGDEISTNVVKEVIAQIKDAVQRVKTNIRLLLKKEEKKLTEQELLDQLVSDIQKKITIKNIPDTRLLDIKVMEGEPEMAARIANLLAKKYIEFDLENRLTSANDNLEWLNKEVYSMKKRLEDDEKKFFEYKQLNKVFSLSGKQKVIDQKIAELNNEYMLTRNRRQELDAKLSEINKQYKNSSDIAHIRSILNNIAIDDIYANLTNLELEQSRLAKVFKSKHPKVQQISSEITKVQLKLKSELSKEIKNLNVLQMVLRERETKMLTNIEELEQDGLDASGKEFNFTILQRNMDTSQHLYDTLVAKMKESGVVTGSASSNIRIVEYASLPMHPVKPNKKKNILLSIILGLFGGIGIAFLMEYLDQSVRTEEDVRGLLDLPVLSVIPIAEKGDKGGYY